MSMSKQDFIRLADAVREYNESAFPAGTNTLRGKRRGLVCWTALGEREYWKGVVETLEGREA